MKIPCHRACGSSRSGRPSVGGRQKQSISRQADLVRLVLSLAE
ncbi:MAG: hypothetical protein OXG81_00455 [Acidobacteria bacterium]|nr:hypothetical protein [Acidobacteriota bacterium]